MTTEDWHNVLYRSVNPWVNTVNGTVEAGHLVSLYFVVAVIVGGCILRPPFWIKYHSQIPSESFLASS